MRFLADCLLATAVFAMLYLATLRTERHPLLIDARSSWCSFEPQGPLVTNPRPYDYQLGKRRIGGNA